jgi:hypothetical protein
VNQYGAQAMRHWQEFLPDRLKAIGTPEQQEAYFERLGLEAADEITTLTAQIAGPDRPDETYGAKLGRLGEARRAAEEIVLRETVLPSPEPDPAWIATPEGQDPTPETWQTPVPDEDDVGEEQPEPPAAATPPPPTA